MFRTVLRHLAARRLRLLTTGIAVLLGVAFMAGTIVLSDTVTQTFDDLFARVNEGTDAVVRSSNVTENDFSQERGEIPAELVEVVAGVEGVRLAAGGIQGYAQVVGTDGKAVGNPGQGPPTFGFNWVSDEALNPFRISEGRPPRGPDEVVLAVGTAVDAGLGVGDTTTVLTKSPAHEVTVVGLATFGSADSPGGAEVVLFTTETAQRLIGTPGSFDGISIAAEEGVDEQVLVDRLSAVLPEGVEAVTGGQVTQEDQDDIGQAIGFFRIFLLTFAGIALFVGAFIIFNTFSILIAQRTRELALLRAVGASRRQVLVAVVGESLVVGLLASAVGVVAGIAVAAGLKGLLASLGLDLPAAGLEVNPTSLVMPFVIGVVLTVVSAVGPARRAAKVPPIAAIRDVALDRSGFSRGRLVAGSAVTALGLLALFAGLAGSGTTGVQMVGLGAAVTFIGAAVLGPVIARPVVGVLSLPLPRLKGTVGTLARQNALRNPARTSATAAALMVGVGLVAFLTIFAASAKASIGKLIDEQVGSDIVIDTAADVFGGLSPQLAAELAELPEVERVVPLRLTTVEAFDSGRFLTATDTAALDQSSIDPGPVAGRVTELGLDEIAVSQDFADDKDLAVGDEVTMQFVDTGKRTLTVVGLFESLVLEPFYVDLVTYEDAVRDHVDSIVFVDVADGTASADALAAVEEVAEPYATARVNDRQGFKDEQSAQINQLLALVFVLLALAIFIAVVGIANTLALSILERTRELGLLRAVGTTRSQLRSTVRWESVLVALFGTGLGIVIGLVFGAALVQALSSEGIEVLSLPVGQLLLLVVLAAVLGVVAAIPPARRAARLDVLSAIYDE